MAKNTMGTKLPQKLEQKMALMGEQIKLARLRRNLSIAQVAERATCSPLTVTRIEKGSPTVSIGIYARVLYALQLDDDLLLIAKEDTLGRSLHKSQTSPTCVKEVIVHRHYEYIGSNHVQIWQKSAQIEPIIQ